MSSFRSKYFEHLLDTVEKAAYFTYSPADIGCRGAGAFWDDALMTRVEIETSDDAGAVLRAGEAFLTRAPVEHNLILTILHERADHPEPGRYWTVSADGRLAGLALQSPAAVPAVLTEVPPDCIEELANAMAADRPNLPGVFGEAATAARFAGCWAERLKIPVAPVDAQRLYRLTTMRPVTHRRAHISQPTSILFAPFPLPCL